MKPVQIIAADDECGLLPFSVPIKGRRPLEFSVPRFQFIPEDDFDELLAEIQALGEQDLAMRKYTRALVLLMVKRFVPEKVYTTLKEKAVTVQLDHISDVWREESELSLGELLASAASSKESTEAPSDTTSKPASESSGETSDGESGGTTSETS